MVMIERHQISLGDIDRRINHLYGRIDFFKARIERKPRLNVDIMKYSKWIAAYSSVGDPRGALLPIWDATWMAMQAGSAMFRNANNPGREIEFTIGFDDHYTVVGTGPNSTANAGKWLAAMYFAAICRRHDRMTELCQTSIETLRASGAVYDEYIYTWVAAFQKFWRNDEEGVIQSLIDAMNAAEPEDMVHASEELLLLLLYPPIELLCIAAQGDAVWFNERLAVALERHKQYWSKTAERRNDVEGFIAWGPLAMACLARDMGLQITVESDYMPVHLLLSERAAEANMIRDDQRRAEQRGRQ